MTAPGGLLGGDGSTPGETSEEGSCQVTSSSCTTHPTQAGPCNCSCAKDATVPSVNVRLTNCKFSGGTHLHLYLQPIDLGNLESPTAI